MLTAAKSSKLLPINIELEEKMSKFDNIEWIKHNDIQPSQGKILISEPFLEDYYFQRAVVLLIDHGSDGSFGVILNKEIITPFQDIIKGMPEINTNLLLGGPVHQDSIFFLHNMGNKIKDSFEVLPNVYWGGDLEQVKDLIAEDKSVIDNFKFFLGYSGWNPDQLEEEISNSNWLVNTTNCKQVFNNSPSNLWTDNIIKLGSEYTHWLNFPKDPSLN